MFGCEMEDQLKTFDLFVQKIDGYNIEDITICQWPIVLIWVMGTRMNLPLSNIHTENVFTIYLN